MHGTLSYYTYHKCRCEACKKAKSEWRRHNRLQNIAREQSRERAARQRYKMWNPIRLQDYHKAYTLKHCDKKRDATLQQTYGISSMQWDQIFDIQKGLCQICQKPLHKYHNPEGKRAAAIDHDHKSKRVRGLVCYTCNRTKIGTNTLETAKRLVTHLESDFDGRKL